MIIKQYRTTGDWQIRWFFFIPILYVEVEEREETSHGQNGLYWERRWKIASKADYLLLTESLQK